MTIYGDLMSGSIYEREIREILSGNEEFIEKFIRNFSEEEKFYYRSIIKKPFFVVRAAGSMGIDIMAVRDDFSIPIEVKSSKENVLRFTQGSSRAQKQAEYYILIARKSGVFPVYAFRLKRANEDPWRFFTIPGMEIHGRMALLYGVLPKMDLTQNGNFILKWEKGLPLHKFFKYINRDFSL